MQFLLTGVPRRDNAIRALCAAAKGTLSKEWDTVSPACLVGNMGGMDTVQRMCVKNGIPYVYIDHAYLEKHPFMERMRVCVNSFQCNDWRDSDRTYNCKVRPWKMSGNHIVIIMPAKVVRSVHPVQEWFDETMAALKQHTDRKIIIKEKGEGALNDVLTDAHAVVCFGSSADVDAVRLGIPAFCGNLSPVYPVALHDLSLIESPSYPDREQWLRSLASAEWHLSELNLAWERIKWLLEHTPNFRQP